MDKKLIGNLGENLAKDFLLKNRIRILETNFRISKMGEIDIIAKEKGTICFIEVKTRTGISFGQPCEAVNYKKQQKIKTLAKLFVSNKELSSSPIRFDIIEVILAKDNHHLIDINYIKNAFY